MEVKLTEQSHFLLYHVSCLVKEVLSGRYYINHHFLVPVGHVYFQYLLV